MAVKAPEFAPEDFISNMPDIVVTNILDRLPVQDAVRTGILSRHWRLKWTMLSKLLFDEKFFLYLITEKGEKNNGRVISRILLHLKGPITKFVLSILDVEDINHWILFLSGKGIKELTLTNFTGTQVKLPTHLFSCLEMKHLKLDHCYFNPPPSFHGFPNLLNLELFRVRVGSGDPGKFFTLCPLLEILKLDHLDSVGNIKIQDIAKLENLKILSLSLCDLDTTTVRNSCTIFELVSFLPKLQELDLDFRDCKLTEGGAKERFPPPFPGLKALKLSRIDLGNAIMFSCAFELIRHFPNLQTLEITAIQRDDDPIPEIEYNALGLHDVLFTSFKGSENEMCLIKYILACSPFLKKAVIQLHWPPAPIEQLRFARKLVKLHRASPVVDIDFY